MNSTGLVAADAEALPFRAAAFDTVVATKVVDQPPGVAAPVSTGAPLPGPGPDHESFPHPTVSIPL